MNKANSRFIAILGPVGIGKSTVINYLVKILRSKNYYVARVFIKAMHGPAYVLWLIISRLLGMPRKWGPYFYVMEAGYKPAKFLKVLSVYLDAFISIPLKILYIKLLNLLGFIVISEEYLPAAIYHHLYDYIRYGIEGNLAYFPLKIIYAFSIHYRPDAIIVLNSSLSTIIDRWKVRGYGDPHPYTYVLPLRIFLLRILMKYFNGNIHVIDADNSNANEIANYIIENIISQ